MEYTHTPIHPWAKWKQSKKKYSRLIQWTKEIKKLYLPVKNKTNKYKLENKAKGRCQVGSKTMKTKLTDMLRGKERKKRKKK